VGKAAGVTDHDVSQDGLPRLSTLVQNFSGQITDAVSGFVHSVAARATNGVGFLFHALINTNSELRLRTPGECRGDAIAGPDRRRCHRQRMSSHEKLLWRK